ncbi:cytochrome d ubiquinol oxidase subunit II [Bacillus taeanensis]|uniref:Cytochrome d ubiquinol oxidase subunit II n=1 Tax=Bacillus taeanensis TaxID=273032 RepID=A0A366Y0Z7_9BACI|nr:cytochrome d ubiquinol oxidase subunit II [Bacillus taeanensis]RBW71516.1 hypothetical protein DS031_01850 [Bacillus taeanensis]
MSDSTIAVLLLWSFIFIYSIAGSVDFGAGFWSMVYSNDRYTRAGKIANRYLSPSWEVTNVFLVLLVVTLYSFFPYAAFSLGTVLLIPASFILILLAIRSAFMVFAYAASKYFKVLRWVSGITGLLIPGLLVSVIPITLGGFIGGGEEGHYLLLEKFLMSPMVYAYIAFGLASELFLSALLLGDYALEAGEEATYQIYRRNAIFLGPMALVAAIFTTLTMQYEAQWIFENIQKEWSLFVFSLVFFLIGYSALWWPKKGNKELLGYPRIAVVSVVIQYGFATFAFGRAHLPYLIYPNRTIENSITNSTLFHELLISYIVGTLILLPGFVYFWFLFMKDRNYLRQD